MADAKTILLVDDDRELIDGLRTLLEKQGYRVVVANDGHQAKTVIYNQKPDLVILDMMMPRMGGYPVLEHFRGKPDTPPIIMITANEGSRHKAYAEYLGVVDYIRKPFAMERLLDAVNKAFAQSKPAEEEEEFGGDVAAGG
jgi:DNA-binding response OmpR family regulator